MTRVYNFAAGPAMLPEAVMLRAKEELFNWRGTGVSPLEIGHRTSTYLDMMTNLQQKIRKVMNIPDNYKVLFLSGGAQGLFSLIPMNLTSKNKSVDYFITGIWSERAAKYARRYADVSIVTTSTSTSIPDKSTWILNPNAKYAFYCSNETINGMRFPESPDTGNVPLVGDFTSSILSENIDITKFGILFASAQKNLGIAGITLMIIRDDLLDESLDTVPEVFNFKNQSENNSILNTIPTYPVYMMDLMIDWVIEQGGVDKISLGVRNKVAKVYKVIDESDFYINSIDAKYRSLVNVPFSLSNPELLNKFLKEADNIGLKYLQGHKLVGGARASIYNSMPEAGVDKLVEFLKYFESTNT